MLTIYGQRQRLCDGVSRRSFLKIGGFAFGAAGGVSLADILRAEAASGRKSPHKAVINIFLGGGPPHQDMWEIKTEAPAEIRGEFKPIDTNVPGIQIGEVFPEDRRHDGQVRRHPLGRRRYAAATTRFQCIDRLASQAIAVVAGRPAEHRLVRRRSCRARSIRRCRRSSAWPPRRSTCRGATPASPASSAPPTPPFKPDGQGMANMKLNGITLDQLARPPQTLLASFDSLQREVDATGTLAGHRTRSPKRAFGVLTSSKLLEALDLSQGRPARSATATATASRTSSSTTAPRPCNDQLLMARRLVEAGVRVRDADLRPLGQPRQELRPGPRPRRASSTRASPPWSRTSTSAACWTT